jgi:hypothetical protein
MLSILYLQLLHARNNDYAFEHFTGGYANTTSQQLMPLTLKFSSGNIDDGIIKMYGVAKS